MTTGLPPPRLGFRRGKRARPDWLLVLLGLLVMLVAARLVEAWHLPTPFCVSRAITDVPCPFCGSTRTVLAVSHLDILGAIQLNPLSFALLAGIAGWSVLRAVEGWLARPLLPAAMIRLRRLPWLWLGLAALLLNWVYVWRTSLP